MPSIQEASFMRAKNLFLTPLTSIELLQCPHRVPGDMPFVSSLVPSVRELTAWGAIKHPENSFADQLIDKNQETEYHLQRIEEGISQSMLGKISIIPRYFGVCPWFRLLAVHQGDGGQPKYLLPHGVRRLGNLWWRLNASSLEISPPHLAGKKKKQKNKNIEMTQRYWALPRTLLTYFKAIIISYILGKVPSVFLDFFQFLLHLGLLNFPSIPSIRGKGKEVNRKRMR